MTDDDLERLLRAARPHTPADDEWTDSDDGRHTLARIRSAVAATVPRRRPVRRARRPFALGIGFAAAVAAAVGLGVLTSGSTDHDHSFAGRTASTSPPSPQGGLPADRMALVAYDNCDAMLAGLRSHLAKHVGPDGLGGGIYHGPVPALGSVKNAAGAAVSQATAPEATTPDHSTTNVQEIGVGEPDIVETDGRRIVTVSGRVLRVVDAATHDITGTLDLGAYAGADNAQLLMAGDRVLVILGNSVSYVRGGPALTPDIAYPYSPDTGGATVLLVDIAQADPAVVGTLHTNGGYVDARMVDGTARVVVESAPKLTFPQPAGHLTSKQRTAYFRNLIMHAPLSAWLPSFSVTGGGTTSTRSVPCGSVSHPVDYTAESMLTVYSIDLAGDLADANPVTLAADGATVYGTATSLYVASSDGAKTQLHRFGISGAGKPTYLGSGSVPGSLLDSYSMSEYQGALRVVTTSAVGESSATSLYELDADTLHVLGSVGGLGAGEQLHAVRFIGALGYVVTFQSVDPLYVLDLADPAHPKRAAALTITGYSDYLHPVSDGRLLGVGESVNSQQIVTGLQVSLFDVDSPAHPTRIARVIRSHTPSESPIDPHAFLFWPATGTAVIPVNSWNEDQSGAALVLHVDRNALQVQGTIRNPAVATVGSSDTGIERTLVIGDDLWTMSSSGLQASNLHSLAKQAWVPFQ